MVHGILCSSANGAGAATWKTRHPPLAARRERCPGGHRLERDRPPSKDSDRAAHHPWAVRAPDPMYTHARGKTGRAHMGFPGSPIRAYYTETTRGLTDECPGARPLSQGTVPRGLHQARSLGGHYSWASPSPVLGDDPPGTRERPWPRERSRWVAEGDAEPRGWAPSGPWGALQFSLGRRRRARRPGGYVRHAFPVSCRSTGRGEGHGLA